MYSIVFRVLRIIYPLDLPDKQRDRPMQVLALGVSRSGTESLRRALLDLGYVDCYHGFHHGASPRDAMQWLRLGHAQEYGDREFLNTTEFDRMMGDCAAVTDIPAIGFAHELIGLYPDAKIILNYREDVDAWHESCVNTLEKVKDHHGSWYSYLRTFFEPHLFWKQRSYYWVWSRHFGNDFKKRGKAWYANHYRLLEERLPAGSYLKWRVQDGWEPLCEYLGKPVPSYAFPDGNIPDQFHEKIANFNAAWEAQADRNMWTTAMTVGSAVVVAASAMFYLRK